MRYSIWPQTGYLPFFSSGWFGGRDDSGEIGDSVVQLSVCGTFGLNFRVSGSFRRLVRSAPRTPHKGEASNHSEQKSANFLPRETRTFDSALMALSSGAGAAGLSGNPGWRRELDRYHLVESGVATSC